MIRVLIADDEQLIRDAVASLLDLEDDLEVVARASSGLHALTEAHRTRPDVALLDLQMPEYDGIDVARRLAAELPACRCIILTSHGRPGYVKSALAAGVAGFLPKTVAGHILGDVIRRVRAGARHIDTDLATETVSAGDSPLTPREADLLRLARDGAPIAEIARRASLSPGTVRNYIASAITKLGTGNRHEAAHIANDRGWL